MLKNVEAYIFLENLLFQAPSFISETCIVVRTHISLYRAVSEMIARNLRSPSKFCKNGGYVAIYSVLLFWIALEPSF